MKKNRLSFFGSVALFISLVFLAACDLVEPFESRGFGYLVYRFEGGRDTIVKKIGVIRDREGAFSRFEGTLDDTVLRELNDRGDLSLLSLGVRQDRREMYVWDQGGSFEDHYISLIDTVDNVGRMFFYLDVLTLSDDALRYCNNENLLANQVEAQLRRRGLLNQEPYEVRYSAWDFFDGDTRATPLGWTPSNEFVIRFQGYFFADVERSGGLLIRLNLIETVFLKFNSETREFSCPSSLPRIGLNARPYATSAIRSNQLIIDGVAVNSFPAVNFVPLFLPGSEKRFFGPFDPPSP